MSLKINGVFQGGGVKGIALTGAVSAAMNQGYEFADMVTRGEFRHYAAVLLVQIDLGK